MDQSPSPEPEEKAANADQTPDAQPVPDEVAASEHEEAEQSPSKDQGPPTHWIDPKRGFKLAPSSHFFLGRTRRTDNVLCGASSVTVAM